jgi:type IV secretion system protein VirB2
MRKLQRLFTYLSTRSKGLLLAVGLISSFVHGQVSPFATGTTAAQANLLAILTPVAVIAVMAVGITCAFGKMSWWWFVGTLIGIVLFFGAPQIVLWVRSMAGV